MQIDGGPLEGPAGPLHDLLAAGLAAQPGDAAIVSAGRALTWRSSTARARASRSPIARWACGPGDRLASLMPNRVELVVHYLACFRAGLVATPLNYRYTFREIDHALEVSGASALLSHAERADDLAASRLAGGLALGTITFREGDADADATHRFDALMAERAAGRRAHGRPRPPTPAAIFFTSGSTGPAKGVTHSIESLRWMVASAGSGLEITDRRRLPPRLVDVAHRLVPVGAELPVGRARAWWWRARTTPHEILPLLRDASADGAGDDPRGARGAHPRPRRAAAGLRVPAAVPRGRGQGLRRAAEPSSPRSRGS